MSFLRIVGKYKKLLTHEQWMKLPLLLLIMIIGGGMEMCSVSLILPFMDMIMKPELSKDKWYIEVLLRVFRTDSMNKLLIILALVLAGIYLIKNIYLIWEISVQQRFVSKAMYETQRYLLDIVLHHPYEYFIGISTSNVLNMLNSKLQNVFGLLSSIMDMTSELVTSGLLIITLVVITPKISLLMALVLAVLLLCVSKIIKPIMKRASDDNINALNGIYKCIIQSVQGIKETKVLKAENFFLSTYEKYGEMFVVSSCRSAVWSGIPRCMIEAVAMSAFLVTVAVHIIRGQYIGNMIPVISAVAVAAVRLLPATNRISRAMANIAYTEPYMDDLLAFMDSVVDKERDITKEVPKAAMPMSFDDRILMDGIDFCYPNSKEVILKGASLEIKKGETIGIIGESGSGKTTTVDILLGLLKPNNGGVFVDKTDITGNIDGWLSMVGYIPQTVFMLDDTIRANIIYGEVRHEGEESSIWDALDEASLGDYIRTLPKGIDTQIGERGMRLSGGQRQRLGIARVLYRNPEVLVFDEATSALDNDTEKAIMESINKLKGQKTMIIIAHRLTTIENCDHVYRVDSGKIKIVR